jgi:hypothetical protein
MLSEARSFMELDPWLALAPGGAITLAVLGFNLFGDGLRDILDPRWPARGRPQALAACSSRVFVITAIPCSIIPAI